MEFWADITSFITGVAISRSLGSGLWYVFSVWIELNEELIMALEIYSHEEQKKAYERTISEALLQNASEQDFKPSWPGQDYQPGDTVELDNFDNRSGDVTPHSSEQQVEPQWRNNDRTH